MFSSLPHGLKQPLRVRRWTAALCMAWLLGGCFHESNGLPPGVDPEKLSRSEYDVARDDWKHGRLRSALEHAQKSVRVDDSFAEAHHFVAILYLALCQTEGDCRYAEAEAAVRRALAADPESRDARHTLGVVLLQQKRYDDAIATLQPLSQDLLYRTPELAWYDLGGAFLDKGDTSRAVDALSRALALKPSYCWANYRLGLALEKQGDLVAAEEQLTHAVEPPDPACRKLQDAYFARARVRAKRKKGADACADVDLCTQLATEARSPQALATGRSCALLRRELTC